MTRHFSRYRADVVYKFKIAGFEIECNYQGYFICAFCLRSLKACINIRPYLPFKSGYCSSSITIYHIEDVGPDAPGLKYTSYDDINKQLVRGLIWDLSTQLLTYQYNDEIIKKAGN